MAYANQTTEHLVIGFNPTGNKINKHICAVIDISASMGSPALITNDLGDKVPTPLNYLDLVKHCLKIIVESMIIEKEYILSLIVFNNHAHTLLNSIDVNMDSKQTIYDTIERIKHNGSTNIWGAINSAYEILMNSSDNLSKNIIIFTDGVPNINPPRGIINTLKSYVKEHNIQNIPIYTLGFGFNLEINTLTEISKISNGSYNYIPSSAELLTVITHLISNIIQQYNVSLKCNIQYKDISNPDTYLKICKYLTPYNYKSTNNCISIDIGKLNSNFTLVLQSTEEEKPTISYELITDKVINSNLEITNIDMDGFTTKNIIRMELILKLIDMYYNSQCGRFHKNNELYQNCLDILDRFNIEDIKMYEKDFIGEIQLALLNSENFNKWGKYYIPSITGAYCRQECNNFRDYGLQTFCSSEFEKLRDDINKMCEEMPDPVPSRQPYVNSQNTTSYTARPVSIQAYQNCGGCLHGSCLIETPEGFIQYDVIKKGDKVKNTDGGISIVECVIKYKCSSNKIQLCLFDNELMITPYHPILYFNRWTFPHQLSTPIEYNCDYVYNIVLNDRKSIYVNGTKCCTLGHGIDGDVIGHPFFGTEVVIDNLKEFVNQYQDGLVYSIRDIKRDETTGLINRYVINH